MSIPKDKKLYESVKKSIYKKIPKHSAYRSGLLVKTYKDRYEKKYGNRDAYIGKKKKKKGLDRWFKEDWKNQRGGKGYKKKGDIYRPTKRVTKDTPVTMKELSKKEKEKAMKEKKRTGRVKKFKSDKK